MAEEAVVHVGDSDFDEEILKADKPSLVDFWAPWCGPCRTIGPTVEALAGQYRDRIKVAKVNIDDNPKTAEAYGVMSIPTLILFKEGKVLDTLVGLVPKERLEAFIGKAL
ncbi:MAG: thioredoxin [Proteobacteria bacterium]|nr:thioredoxin [Pseudomonadota bacterium]MBU2226988.1 thioredoxin [Pseudomonadota bacterium]MBU2262353.1 thioredoxin [Pseudomonadota bacterium]